MAHMNKDQADQAAKEAAQIKLTKSLASALRDNQEALLLLPEMLEQLIEVQEAKSDKTTEEQNLNTASGDEQKAILAKRKVADLESTVASLQHDNDTKSQRIQLLEQTVSDHKREIRAIKNTQNAKHSRDERISWLEDELKVVEEDNTLKRATINELKETYESTLSRQDKEIEQLKSSLEQKGNQLEETIKSRETLKLRNDDLIESNKAKEEQIEKQAERISALKNNLSALENDLKAKNDRKNDNSARDVVAKDKEQGKQSEKIAELKEKFKVALSDKEREIAQTKDRNDDLVEGIKTKEEKIKKQAERNDKLVRDIAAMDEKIKAQLQCIETKEEKIKEQDERFNQLKENSKTSLIRKDREIEQLKSRVASLSEKQLKRDQSKVEDTLSMNRQSKLEEDFSNFVSDARLDACERIQSLYGSGVDIYVHIYYPRLACLIFEAAYERMKEAKEDIFEFFKEIISSMIRSVPKMSHLFTTNKKNGIRTYNVTSHVEVHRQETQYPTDVLDALMLTLKETSHNCNLDCFVEDVQHIIRNKWNTWHHREKSCSLLPRESVLYDSRVVFYIKQCIHLTWRMVTQVPALQIEYQSTYLKSIHQKKAYHSSPDMCTKASGGQVPGEEIACYLWPGLLDGNGRLIRAGEVLCKIKN